MRVDRRREGDAKIFRERNSQTLSCEGRVRKKDRIAKPESIMVRDYGKSEARYLGLKKLSEYPLNAERWPPAIEARVSSQGKYIPIEKSMQSHILCDCEKRTGNQRLRVPINLACQLFRRNTRPPQDARNSRKKSITTKTNGTTEINNFVYQIDRLSQTWYSSRIPG